MAAELKRRKAPTKEARRILLRQIDKALSVLETPRASDSKIHDARRQIKRARATLRLLRNLVPAAQYQAENACLRDAARPLSKVRDASVLVDTFKHLVARTDGRPPLSGAISFGRELVKERARIRVAADGRSGVPQARSLLHSARSRASHWQLAGKGWSVVGAGVEKVYSQGRDALADVRKRPRDASFHELRKQTKYLRHQLQLLQPAWPRAIDPLVKELHRLSDQLGDDHDLAVLGQKLDDDEEAFVDENSRQVLRATINGRRSSLQRQALRLGARIYEEKPKHFTSRLHGYWRDWRDE